MACVCAVVCFPLLTTKKKLVSLLLDSDCAIVPVLLRLLAKQKGAREYAKKKDEENEEDKPASPSGK